LGITRRRAVAGTAAIFLTARLTGDFLVDAGFPTLDKYLRFLDFDAAGFVAVCFFGFTGVAAVDTAHAASARIPR